MTRPISLLFVSTLLLLTGHGLQLSLLPLHARSIGWDDPAIGITGAMYFCGFIVGCLSAPSMLRSAGAVRVFASMCAVMAGVFLTLELTESLYAWVVLRLITGWSIAAVYTTVEGWLNECASNENRGRLLSIYVIVTLAGFALGQTLLGVVPPDHLFFAGALMMMAAILPISLFCEEQTVDLRQVRLRPEMLAELPLVATVGILLGGIVTGGIWTLAPLIGEDRGFSHGTIAIMMNALILGGAVLQLPLGAASDRFGRQRLIGAAGGLGVLASLIACFIPSAATWSFLVTMFLFGGISLSLYALCAAEGQDKSTLGRVETASLLLLIYGVGSVFGSSLIGLGLAFTGNALFIAAAVCFLLLVALALRIQDAEIVVFPSELATDPALLPNLDRAA